MKRPRDIFRSRARERRNRIDVSPAATTLKPGHAYELRHWHDADCRRPQGGSCTCKSGGPDLELVPMIDPMEN